MPKTNLKTLAYNTIREKIVTCEYAPGTFLNEALLTEELNLSRTPVRDALSRLEQEGLVEIRPKKGIIVTPLSVNMINMIFEVRQLYEPYILRTYGALIPSEKLMEFYEILLKKDSAERCQVDRDYFYELDSRFHNLLVSACPNIYIRQNYQMIQTQNERFRHMTGEDSKERLTDTIQEHLDIVKPCLAGDFETAAAKLSYHLEESKKASFKLIFTAMDQQPISL